MYVLFIRCENTKIQIFLNTRVFAKKIMVEVAKSFGLRLI